MAEIIANELANGVVWFAVGYVFREAVLRIEHRAHRG